MFGPHETNLGRRRTISDRHVAYYRRRAAGGAGIIVTEEASVHPTDWPYERAPLATDAGPGWTAVATACHAEGALTIAAVGHAGGQGSSAYHQLPLWAPSRVPEVNSREVPKWMEIEDIEATIAGFGTATAAAVAAGMDGVEINAGQHSLVRQFLSGLTNQRDDDWGSDRARYLDRVLATVRAAAPGATVGLRLSCDELAPWAGITPESAAILVGALAARIDYLVVVRGSIYTVSASRPDGHVAAGFNRELTAAMRSAAVGTPVFWQGSVIDVGAAETAVAEGVCDGVEMTRAQIADPDLVAKAGRGDAGRIRPCILCNQTCMVRDNRNPLLTCVVEPSAGHETEDRPVAGDGPGDPHPDNGRHHPSPPIRLLVVGAGPAGLEAARVAAQAGCDVTLAEQRGQAGGLLRVAATAQGRASFGPFVDWLESECRGLGVQLVTATTFDADAVAAHDGPVILATGSHTAPLAYEVDPGATVVDAAAYLEAAAHPSGAPDLPAGPVVVWDPLGGSIAVAMAETLAGAGRSVTLVTPDNIVGTQLSRTGDLAPGNVRLLGAGVTLVKRVDLIAVGSATVTVVDKFSGQSQTLPATAVVDCGARRPEDGLWHSTGSTLARAGDAVAPRTVLEAVLEGRRAAQAVVTGAGARRPQPVGAPGGGG
jgi:mycofactocin system FadH/OYE family oxidoreductase 1